MMHYLEGEVLKLTREEGGALGCAFRVYRATA
jgi:hypothetical protein